MNYSRYRRITDMRKRKRPGTSRMRQLVECRVHGVLLVREGHYSLYCPKCEPELALTNAQTLAARRKKRDKRVPSKPQR